ncbi:hypothetical protein KIW84_070823 [Lathyrus oleraceus]|uniref:Uncharacterized protein n=1 Tax=Pisum sativum TaxID=3888 RepID=A0A9D4VGQ9_PEA|nr:hypothetical protein KIW84_070823 [Pisum sativum]
MTSNHPHDLNQMNINPNPNNTTKYQHQNLTQCPGSQDCQDYDYIKLKFLGPEQPKCNSELVKYGSEAPILYHLSLRDFVKGEEVTEYHSDVEVIDLLGKHSDLMSEFNGFLKHCENIEERSFMEGRFILDNALIAIEIIHALKRKTRGNKVELDLKIDISKAYDIVDWGFFRGLSSVIAPRIKSFNEARKLIYDICSKEDRKTASRVVAMVWVFWNNMNNWI